MKQLKAALFDLDGTLIDSEGQYTQHWGSVGRKYHPEMPNFAYDIKGTTLKDILTKYFDKSLWEEVTKAIDDFEKTMVFPRIAGAEAFIKDLKNHRVKCIVVTSSPVSKMKNLEEKEPEFLSLFDKILTAEQFKASKPDPDCYLQGAKTADCQTDECIVFEDAFTGLQAGMSAGIFTIGLATVNSREAIQDKCNYVIDNFVGLNYEELLKIWNK